MDPQADSDEEFVVLSTSDYTGSASYTGAVFPQAGGLTNNAKLLVKSFSLLFSRLGARVAEKQWGDKLPTIVRSSTITIISMEGEEAVGGEGSGQGGDGGTGHGPTVYFGQPEVREPSAFRTIQLGDLNLVKEFKEMRSSPRWSVVGCQTPRATVRRVYKAKLEGRESGHMTVAVYEGDGAEEEATKYIGDVTVLLPMNPMSLPGWIQPQTGQFCLDLAQGGATCGYDLLEWDTHVLRLENVSLDAPDSEDMIISSLSENQYHEMDSYRGTCGWITEPLPILPEELHWAKYGGAPGELLSNSWIRYGISQTFTLELRLNLWFPSLQIRKAWLAQANHIFAELHEPEHIEDYVCVKYVQFILQIADKHNIPKGYLFVCSPQDFRTHTEPHANLYQWPACPAYWSLDPSGADRLSTEDARNLSFPAIHIETRMFGDSWAGSVYEGLRQFHKGKGFDPESREVARRLGYPLYEVSSDRVPFAAREGELQLDDLFYAVFY
ncbi:hypothetical protein MSAN_01500200 [Mycena sanguinolenta]|uniref:Uncharacterized protein n=1 Tax=Mycena sanguinolenta TaxID=230812 RepID=A0A8H7CZH8_9AGAR|nr:hypothetical protein MSAN_01500200 [Mycena sanguinolenta]